MQEVAIGGCLGLRRCRGLVDRAAASTWRASNGYVRGGGWREAAIEEEETIRYYGTVGSGRESVRLLDGCRAVEFVLARIQGEFERRGKGMTEQSEQDGR
jgi:hypothetical protein